jgi:tetratricopeptide (TPR) repeat protein
MEEADWRATLRMARDAREKAQLWRLVGVKQDGIVAFQEIVKLDPKSDLLGLLAVRELARIESMVPSDMPARGDAAAQRKAYAALEQLVVAQAATPGADRPWLMELVAGHIAARRGDVAAAKERLARATKGKPGDAHVATQAKASYALALALDWKLNPAREQELAKTMGEVDAKFARLGPVRSEVRTTLAASYLKAGKLVEAEFLKPGSVTDAVYASHTKLSKAPWSDPGFLKDMIARSGRTGTAFDRFVLAGSYTRPALEQELALHCLVEGNFAAASQTFKTTRAASAKLGTDPFVVHFVDCHDCDHKQYANAPWTHASFAARLDELARAAKGTTEAAAEAALALGNAMYNVTWYGNARVVLADSHYATKDTGAAEKWYRRAFDISKNRELKAKAAYLAAKAELGGLITAAEAANKPTDPLPIAKEWFGQLKDYKDTQYYRDVLKECGTFADWVRRKRP